MRYCALFIAALFASGCGLVDSDVTNFDISLPQKTLSVDTAQWMLPGMETFPAVSCDPVDVCAQSLNMICGSDDCSAGCDGTNCEVTVAVHLFTDFNLQMENPALQELDERALISVSISRIFFEVPANTMNVDSPELGVYLAPVTVMSPQDAQAELIATIPSVPAGMLVTEGELEIDAAGEAVIERFLEDWTTPFNVILAEDVVIAAGDLVPTGKIDAAVRVNASAGIQ